MNETGDLSEKLAAALNEAAHTTLSHETRQALERTALIEQIEKTSSLDMESLSHQERGNILRVLIPLPFTSKKPAFDDPVEEMRLLKAVEQILETTPYPGREELRDRQIARDYLQQFQRLYANGDLDIPILQAHLGDSRPFIHLATRAALQSMGLVPGLITVHVAEKPQKAFNADIDGETDFTGFAHVGCDLDKAAKQLDVTITINADSPFLQHFHPDKEDTIIYLAAAVLHEISHVEHHVSLLHRENINKLVTADWMLAQRMQVSPYRHTYDIYRSLLNERQAYNRQHLFTAMAGDRPIQAEITYLLADKNARHVTAQMMETATNSSPPQDAPKPSMV